jgi:hypothetical protein
LFEMFRNHQQIIAFGFILLTINMLVGCNFFKVSTTYSITPEQLEIAKEDYIIVHMPSGEAYRLDHLIIDTEKNEITGVKEKIDAEHHLLKDVSSSSNKYQPKLNPRHDELHLYATANEEISTGHVKILLEDISKVEVYNKQTGKSILSYVGGAVVFAGVAFIIFALTKSSCPFIYTLDENDYNFRGEIYGGAIAPNLERDDYMPLPDFTSIDSLFKLKITNELKERQYTDVAELLMVEHADDMEVLMDSYGVPYSLKHPVSPRSAQTDLGNDYLSEIKTHDGVAYQFFDETTENQDFSSIDLSFIATGTTNQMKLVLNLKNTIWLDHTFERFGSLMGDQYDRISSKQNRSPADQKIQWSKDEGIMLAVQLKTANGWRTIDYINTVGPLASRSIVVPIEADCQAGDEFIVRLESGYHFWEVDYAAMDFTSNDPLEITRLPLLAAVDENNIDLMSEIAHHDGTYLEQPYIGAEAILTFDGHPSIQSQKTTSLFLHTRGYYEYIRDYTGKPNISELKKFQLTGSFARFTKTRLSQTAGL